MANVQETYDTQVGASATVQNALVGTSLARAPDHGLLHVYGRQENTAAGSIRLDVKIDTESVMPNSGMTRNDALHPNKMDDHLGTFAVTKGAQIIPTIREVLGVAMDLEIIFAFEARTIQQLIALGYT